MYGNLYIIYANLFLKNENVHLLFLIKKVSVYDCCMYDFLDEED